MIRALRDSAARPEGSPQAFANTALKGAAGLWFVVAVIGQLTFAFYITVFYGRAAMRWDFVKWNKALEIGYVPGDTPGNIAVASHLALAVIIIVGGALQLTPQIRKRAPSFHRWSCIC